MAVNHTLKDVNRTVICFSETIYRTNGVWEGPNPMSPILPVFIFQLPLLIFFPHIILLALKPFNMPPFVGKLIGGIILGPSFFGKIDPAIYKWFFPTYGFTVLEPMAHFALIFYAFLKGLTTDLQTICQFGTQPIRIALSGTMIPFIIGCCSFFFIKSDQSTSLGSIYCGTALTVSGYSALAQILEKQALAETELGKLVMASAQVTELISWGLFALGLASSNHSNAFYALLLLAAFVFICIYFIRPALRWTIRRTTKGQGYSEFYLCFVLSGVALCGVMADAIGTHPMIGAFIFGLIIPDEVLQSELVDRLEDFVTGTFMPAFFAVCGLRTNFDSLTGNFWVLAMVMLFLIGAKIFGVTVASSFTNLRTKEAATIGLITSTKGTLALIILETAQEHGDLNTQEYSIVVVSVLVMTMLVIPAAVLYRPNNNVLPYKRKTIQTSKSEEELRVLACIHGVRNVPSIINLLEASNASQRSPISVYALHLVELIGRTSNMLVVHSARETGSRHPANREAQTEQIISAFDNYELRCDGVTVQALTARSAFSTMDEDICAIARSKRATFIMLPFHRQQIQDGEMEDINPAIRTVNENVLANAPCSVGLLIDRRPADSGEFPRRVAALFFGGPDDREALAYAWRISEHQNVRLKVFRFVPGKDVFPVDPMDFIGAVHGNVTVQIDVENEKLLDDEFLNKFKIATVNDNSILYQEMVLNDEEDTVRAIKAMENDYDLFIVGKGRRMVSPLTAGLADWCDCPEIGPIGDLFATSDFSSSFSVLVMQQYIRREGSEYGSGRSRGTIVEHEMESVKWRPSDVDNDAFVSFDRGERGFDTER